MQLLCTAFDEPMYFYNNSIEVRPGPGLKHAPLRLESPFDKENIQLLNASGYTKTLTCAYFMSHEFGVVSWTVQHTNSSKERNISASRVSPIKCFVENVIMDNVL